jgi:hypothetical protein
MKSSERLKLAVGLLLADITLPGEARSLLLKHPARPDIFFPLVSHSKTGVKATEIDDHYYLYSTQLSEASCSGVPSIFDNNSEVEELLFRGKLAVRLFGSGPVAVRTEFCGREGNIALCTMQQAKDGCKLKETSENFRLAIAELVDAWRELSESSVQIDKDDPEQVAAAVTSLLCDAVAEPPYFPILYAAAASDPSGESGQATAQWNANALCHNIYLLADREKLVHDYISEMVQNSTEQAYFALKPTPEIGGIPGAIATVCKDRVHVVARLSDTNVRIFARCNIPHSDPKAEFPDPDRILANRIFPAPNNWALIRHALEYLDDRHEESALVTAWFGTVIDDIVKALPVGFAPGQRLDALRFAATQPQLGLRFDKIGAEGDPLSVNVIFLDELDGQGVAPPVRARTKELLDTIQQRATSAIAGLDAVIRYPGPYTLDFQGTETLPLLIKSGSGSANTVKLASGERDHTFLLDICEQAKKVYPVTHQDIQIRYGDKKKQKNLASDSTRESLKVKDPQVARRFVEGFNKRMRKLGLDPRQIVKNIPGKGWTLFPESQAIRLPRNKRRHS